MRASRPGFDWREFDAYLFDIDGTLLNSRDAVHYFAFHEALRQVFGREIKIDAVPVHGNTDLGILRAAVHQHGISDDDFERELPRILEIMRSEVEGNAAGLKPELCPSVSELLKILHSGDKLLGVASGNLEAIAWRKLRAAGIREYFSFGSFSDKLEFRKEIFAHALEEAHRRIGVTGRVCFVGDTPSDVQAARAINAPIIAVATGTYSVAQLQEHSPNACVACVADLPLPHP